LDYGGGKLVEHNFMVGQRISKNFLKKKAKLTPWMSKKALKTFAQIGSHGILWIPSTTNVLPLLGGNNQGGYGVVRKVQTKRFDYISSTIALAGKTPKMDDKWKTCKQCLVEALAYPCEHPSVIKFLAIHVKTMEAYTLWWNGKTLQEMLDYNMKHSPIMDTQTLL
jgi:hypothetical protein